MDQFETNPDSDVRFNGYRSSVDAFIQDVLSASVIENNDYVPGSQRIEFFEKLRESTDDFPIFDYRESGSPPQSGIYEEALFHRVSSSGPGLLVLIGGLGSGKSTSIRHLCEMVNGRQPSISISYTCSCNPCTRRPIVIDCLDLDLSFTTNECEAEVMMRLRRSVYNQLLDEWLIHHGMELNKVSLEQRKVLRRLLIANDIYHWADQESLEFPATLHTTNLELPYNLLEHSPEEWDIPSLVKDYTSASNSLDQPIQEILPAIGLGKRFTALVLGFWLRACNASSPNNLIVVDNLDQQPTDNIEQIVNHLHDLDIRNRGLRILLPLRPSSIVPHGFTKNTNYMYHYGPNCFDIIYRRLSKYVLARERSALTSGSDGRAVFTSPSSQEEIICFLVVSYIYAMICLYGLRGSHSETTEPCPEVHPDHKFLHRINFSTSAIQQLADTLGAVVGTCGRYATDQLRRYFDHVYSRHSFLRRIEVAGLAMGASPRIPIPFGQVVSAVLGAHGGDNGVTGLANLYSPTQTRANAQLPSLAKLRILAFLSIKGRAKVRDVIASLAHFGIPWEISLASLNYLHRKNRLLLWFSRNTDLPANNPDIDQYVVISEHGQAYFSDLVGDFEYVWFCAQQILAVATSDRANFSRKTFLERLGDYSQLLVELSRAEWKQLTFGRCSSSSVWPLASTAIESGEMIALYILYASLDRALRSSAVAARFRNSAYIDELCIVLDGIIELIIRRQDEYEIYYGDNGYRSTYAVKIERSQHEVERMLGEASFSSIHPGLESLLAIWNEPVRKSPLPDLVGSSGASLPHSEMHPLDDSRWLKLIDGMQNPALSTEAVHALARTRSSMVRLLERRSALRIVLATRFPAYSFVDHQLAQLIEELKAGCESADLLAGYSSALLNWLKSELDSCIEIRNVINSESFKTPDISSMSEMDDMKSRANGICIAFGTLAQRLGVENIQHLAVRWSV